MIITPVVVGIDVAQAELVVAVRPTRDAQTVPNDEGGVADVVRRLRPLHPALVVLEATGGYERLVVATLAALAGVAPFARDSGIWRGRRHVRGGRAPVRRASYMAALVATRHNPIIKAFYERLLAAANPRRSRSPPACANYSPSSMRWCDPTPSGGARPHRQLDIKDSCYRLVFNLFNNTNFNPVGGTLAPSYVGSVKDNCQVTSAVDQSRMMQLAFRILF